MTEDFYNQLAPYNPARRKAFELSRQVAQVHGD